VELKSSEWDGSAFIKIHEIFAWNKVHLKNTIYNFISFMKHIHHMWIQVTKLAWRMLMSLTQSHFIFQRVGKGTFGSVLKAMIPNIISAISRKCVTCFEVTQCGFPCTSNGGLKANQHGNMSCFDGNPMFSLIKNHTPWNMSLETRTSKPTTHQNMSSFGQRPNTCFDA
jgi:hypothetical protein